MESTSMNLGVPKCCLNCLHFDTDYSEWSDLWYHYCMRNIKLPIKKQSCKRQQERRPINRKKEATDE